jgi:hypothetical protein
MWGEAFFGVVQNVKKIGKKTIHLRLQFSVKPVNVIFRF